MNQTNQNTARLLVRDHLTRRCKCSVRFSRIKVVRRTGCRAGRRGGLASISLLRVSLLLEKLGERHRLRYHGQGHCGTILVIARVVGVLKTEVLLLSRLTGACISRQDAQTGTGRRHVG